MMLVWSLCHRLCLLFSSDCTAILTCILNKFWQSLFSNFCVSFSFHAAALELPWLIFVRWTGHSNSYSKTSHQLPLIPTDSWGFSASWLQPLLVFVLKESLQWFSVSQWVKLCPFQGCCMSALGEIRTLLGPLIQREIVVSYVCYTYIIYVFSSLASKSHTSFPFNNYITFFLLKSLWGFYLWQDLNKCIFCKMCVLFLPNV